MSSSQAQASKRSRKGKNIATSSSGPRQPGWPRESGRPFTLPPHLEPIVLNKPKSQNIDGFFYRSTSDHWLQYHSVFYNGLLNVTFEPTRVLDMEALDRLDLKESVMLLLHTMGFGNMAYKSYDLYLDLARQFLASCEVFYDDVCSNASAGKLKFLCNGRRYSLTLNQLAKIFEFHTTPTVRTFNNQSLAAMDYFWKTIAFRNLNASELKISRIRNSALKVVAKAMGHTFFWKEGTREH